MRYGFSTGCWPDFERYGARWIHLDIEQGPTKSAGGQSCLYVCFAAISSYAPDRTVFPKLHRLEVRCRDTILAANGRNTLAMAEKVPWIAPMAHEYAKLSIPNVLTLAPVQLSQHADVMHADDGHRMTRWTIIAKSIPGHATTQP